MIKLATKLSARTWASGLMGAVMAAGCIIGSAVTAQAQERTLAGITIGRPATQIFQKYGNPTRIDFGQATPAQGQQMQQFDPAQQGLPSPQQFGLPAMPGMTGGDPGSMMPPPGAMPAPGGAGPNPTAMGALAGNLASSLFGGQATAPTPGIGGPGMMMPGMMGQQEQQAFPQRRVTRYFYDYPEGPSLRFVVGHKGLVEQIDAFAPWPWSPARTSRGINVGSTYAQVIARYGYPDDQRQNNDGTMVMDYSESARCAFTLLGGKVVGVSVALVE